jgi:hypothetical protein
MSDEGEARRHENLRVDGSLQSTSTHPDLHGLRINLQVVLAACSGVFLTRLLDLTDAAPAWGIIGPRASIGGAVLYHAYRAYYEEVFASLDGVRALHELKRSSPDADDLIEIYTAEFLFPRIFCAYLPSHAAIQELGLAVARARGMDPAAARDLIQRVHGSPTEVFERSKELFFMLNLIPENRERFDVPMPDCME